MVCCDTKSAKGITWFTKANTSSVVNIYDENGAKVNATVTCADVFEFEGNYVHKANVSGLAAGKTYYYEVGNGETFSEMGKFVTDDGDRLNLKSKLCQFIGLARLVEGGMIDKAKIVCDNIEDDSLLFRFNLYGDNILAEEEKKS